MYTTKCFAHNRQSFSLEIFPPKPFASPESLYTALEGLRHLNPDFVSVTFGAGGSQNTHKTIDLAADVKQDYGMESVAHLACIHLDKAQVLELLRRLEERGIENVLALRGDLSPEIRPKSDFRYASDLVAFIRKNSQMNVLGACYPEGHLESDTRESDIHFLKKKVDTGVSQLISQLFFQNEDFYRFLDNARAAGIHVPIEAGIMPVTSRQQIGRMAVLCGASLPRPLLKLLHRYGDNPDDMRRAGTDFAIQQIQDLYAQGVDGVHLYTMNNAKIATDIYTACVPPRTPLSVV